MTPKLQDLMVLAYLLISTYVLADVSSSQSPQPMVLRPISINEIHQKRGLHRRSTSDISHLVPADVAELPYGAKTQHGDDFVARMTLFAPEGMQIVSMEKFTGLTAAIDCDGSDGMVSMTFNSETAYKHAIEVWSHINLKAEDKFLLVTNAPGCGPQNERQSYIISEVREQAESWTTQLIALKAAWADVAANYDLDFGHMTAANASHAKLAKRNFWDDIGNAFKSVGEKIWNGIKDFGNKIVDGFKNIGKVIETGAQAVDVVVTGTGEIGTSLVFPMSMGTAHERVNIYTSPDGTQTLDCVNCYVSGSWEVSGSLSTRYWQLEKLEIAAQPHSFGAALDMEAVLTASHGPKVLNYDKELWSMAIPDAGFVIPGIFKVGATASYHIGIGVDFAGTVDVEFGLNSTVPDTARATINLKDLGHSSAQGFEAIIQPIFDVKSLEGALTISAWSKPQLEFGIEILKIGTANVALPLKLPEINAVFSPGWNAQGFCESDQSISTGVKLTSDVTIGLDAEVNVAFGEQEASQQPLWSHKLFGWDWQIASQCFPLAISGLEGGSSSGVVNSTSADPAARASTSVARSKSLSTQPKESVTSSPSPSAPRSSKNETQFSVLPPSTAQPRSMSLTSSRSFVKSTTKASSGTSRNQTHFSHLATSTAQSRSLSLAPTATASRSPIKSITRASSENSHASTSGRKVTLPAATSSRVSLIIPVQSHNSTLATKFITSRVAAQSIRPSSTLHRNTTVTITTAAIKRQTTASRSSAAVSSSTKVVTV